ncbi:MAG: DUF1176 domain-containing protein [Beijerinckiaceae bacterium]|nr:DUF1176 domain-containing protein [Beijerinckiaceae bacterium]
MPRYLTLAACALTAALASGNALAQSVRLFTDWQAACDNLRSCSAMAMGPLDAHSLGFIDVRRSGARDADTQVSLAFTFETELQELPLELTFDPPGGDTVFPRDAKAEIGHDGLLRVELPREKLTAFIAALRRAEFLHVRRRDDAATDQSATVISLKGAIAALRWIDEQQHRAGGVTALVARGERAAAAIPAPPPLPVIGRAPFQVRQIVGKAPANVIGQRKTACPDLGEDSEGDEIGYQITSDIVLWQMPCSRAAYNFANVYYLQIRNGPPRLVQFEKPEDGALVRNMTEIVNGEFNEDDRSIFFFAKGRGLGDCGVRGAYVWDGRAFMLANWQEMTACRGAPLDLWPFLWRAEARGR